MTVHEIFFWLLAAGVCAGSVAVVISQNVVRMAFYLIIALGSTAGLFFLLYADFVGAAQLLIYVGGTVVLLIFGVMLTATGPFLQIKASPADGILAAVVGSLFLGMLIFTVTAVDWEGAADKLAGEPVEVGPGEGYNPPQAGNTARPIGLSLLGLRPDKDLGAAEGERSSGYLLPFEIVSVHLLVVLIGAAYLARAKRRVESSEKT